MNPSRRWTALIAFALAPAGAAETYSGAPADYLSLLKKLQPGDTLTLAAGDYTGGLPVHNLVGQRGKPIVIAGPRGQQRARFLARQDTHTVSIVNSAWIEIRNLELEGNGLPVAAVRAEGYSDWAHHITLDNLTIRGHGSGQQTVGIASFCPAWDWVIRNNTIIGAGTGMYLGQSDGSAPFVAGLIERNLIVDSIGYNLQIKHQLPRPHIDGMPEGDSVTIIRHNVFVKSENGSTAEAARPNLLVGHWPLAGPGMNDTYAIYGNFFYQNPTEALFQGEGNIAFYSNVLVNTAGDAINIRPHNDVPRRIDIFHNTVLAGGSGIRVTGGHPEYVQRVVANAIFATVPITGGEQLANSIGSFAEAADQLANPYAALGQLDLAPVAGKLVTTPIDVWPPVPVPDLNRDFEGRGYAAPRAGAYAESVANWRLRIAPKR
ncbi:MAG TPA: hypothetical protein VKF40_23670 [Burkholderiales bacterium]|nr:hypothetical protein [Burkholderiales bacterium]